MVIESEEHNDLVFAEKRREDKEMDLFLRVILLF
jgi:hypothetical protein